MGYHEPINLPRDPCREKSACKGGEGEANGAFAGGWANEVSRFFATFKSDAE